MLAGGFPLELPSWVGRQLIPLCSHDVNGDSAGARQPLDYAVVSKDLTPGSPFLFRIFFIRRPHALTSARGIADLF
jgi:hypothetical protein